MAEGVDKLETAGPQRRLYWLAAGLLAMAGAASAFTLVWDDDIHWHIAGGQWMLEHGRVLRVDPFAVGETPGVPNEWVNVHWLFQLLVAGVYRAAGFEGITLLRAALAAAWMLLFAAVLRRWIGPRWLVAVGLMSLAVIAGRLRARPETFTYLFLLLTVATVESVRRGASPRRMWLLVPVMLVWANMHVLCVLALAVIASGIAGAWLERRLRPGTPPEQVAGNLLTRTSLLAAGAAFLVCLATPWPGTVFTHSLLLSTRLSGGLAAQDSPASGPQVYSQDISELRPVWDDLRQDPLSHGALALTLLVTAAAMGANWRRVRPAHLLWVLAFATLALLARRNIALLGPTCGYLAALHGRDVLARWPAAWRPRGRALARTATAVLLAGPPLLALAYATEWVFRVRNEIQRIGMGVHEGIYPVATAKFLGALEADGDVECDNIGEASAFIQYSSGRRKVFMDGRLEVNSQKRFEEHKELIRRLCQVDTADTAPMPPTVRFVVARAASDRLLDSLSHSRRFELVHLSADSACFARLDWPAGTPLPAAGSIEEARLRKAARSLAGPGLEAFDRPLAADGRSVEGTRREVWRWYRQNVEAKAYQVGEMFLGMGRRPTGWSGRTTQPHRPAVLLAVRYLTAAQHEDGVPPGFRQGLLAKALQELGEQDLRDWEEAVVSEDGSREALPLNVRLAASVAQYDRMDIADAEDTNRLTFAIQKGYALYVAGQREAAREFMADLAGRLPEPDRIAKHRLDDYRRRYDYLRKEAFRVRDEIARKCALAQEQARKAGADSSDPLAITRDLRTLGLARAAATLLERLDEPTSLERLALGDVYTQMGQTKRARDIYARVPATSRAAREALPLRLALCRWIEGDLAGADEELARATAVKGAPAGAWVYRAMLAETTGRYALARDSLDRAAAEASDPSLRRLVERMQARLKGVARASRP